MNHISMSGLLKEIGLMAIVLAVIVLITVACSVKRKHETANKWKFRTVVLVILGLGLSQFFKLWIVMMPLYLFLAWRSFRAGQSGSTETAAPVHPIKSVWFFVWEALAWLIKETIENNCGSQNNRPVEDTYYFDPSGAPYLVPQSSPYLDAREGY